MIECKECGKLCTSVRGLGNHVTKSHDISTSEYVIKHDLDGVIPKCLICGDSLTFHGMYHGFSTYCSNSCGTTGMMKNRHHRDRVSKQLTEQWMCPEFRKERSEESSVRLSERNKIKWKDPEYRISQSKVSSRTLSKTLFRSWKNSEFRHKMLSRPCSRKWNAINWIAKSSNHNDRHLYIVEYASMIKIGHTRDFAIRSSYLPRDPINTYVFLGSPKDVIYMECNLLIEYMDSVIPGHYALMNSSEFLYRTVKDSILESLRSSNLSECQLEEVLCG